MLVRVVDESNVNAYPKWGLPGMVKMFVVIWILSGVDALPFREGRTR